MGSYLKNTFIITVTGVILALFPHCTTDIQGGGSEAGNARITGIVTDAQGSPVGNVIVQILPFDFDPVKDIPAGDFSIDTTTDDGRYRFGVTIGNIYSIQALHTVSRSRALITSVEASDADNMIEGCILQPPGAMRVMLSTPIDTATDYIYIPGTTIHAFVKNMGGYVLLDSVPAGIVPSVSYSSISREKPVVIRENVAIRSQDTVTIALQDWLYSKSIILNTSASGADIQGNVYGFPVLVRLTSDIFDFTQARTGGEDIRFTSNNGSPLPYEIEQWDSVARRAAVWVRVDTIYGNNSTQTITMYWGNADATDSSSSAAVFDTADGFHGVWHLGDASGDLIHDATINRYHGVSPDTGRPQVAEGMIGKGRSFDGVNDYITMPNTADGTLNFPQESNYTVSAWVFLDTVNNASQLIVAKGYEQYYLRLTFFPSNSPMWEFVEFTETGDWQTSTHRATSRQWTLLTGVRRGTSQFLYCNGILVDSTVDVWTNVLSRNTSNDISIGKFMEEMPILDFPVNEGYCYFKGSIDEVRILNKVESRDRVRLCYMNQKFDDQLVEFNQ